MNNFFNQSDGDVHICNYDKDCKCNFFYLRNDIQIVYLHDDIP